MKRRNFIKWFLGVSGLGVSTFCLPKVEEKEAEAIPTLPPKLGDVYHVKKEQIYLDEIVASTTFKGRLLVFCKHSIWELEENCLGELQRKLIQKL